MVYALVAACLLLAMAFVCVLWLWLETMHELVVQSDRHEEQRQAWADERERLLSSLEGKPCGKP